MAEKTYDELEALFKSGQVTKSTPDKFGVSFYEGDGIHIYKNMHTKQTVPGTTSSIGGFTNVQGLSQGGQFSGLLVDEKSGSIIDKATMSKASNRGTRIHGAMEAWIGTKNGNATHEDLSSALSLLNEEELGAYHSTVERFSLDKNLNQLDLSQARAEVSLSSAEHGFAGTIDVLAPFKNGSGHGIVDFKFGKEVERKVGYQTAANAITVMENYPEIENIRRFSVHTPEPKAGTKHSTLVYNDEGANPKQFGSLQEDMAKFLELKDIPHRSEMGIEDANAFIRANILKSHREAKPTGFGMLHIGFDENNNVQEELVGHISAQAEELGLTMSEGRATAKGKGLLYSFTKEAELSQAQRQNMKLAEETLSSFAGKENVPFLSALNQGWDELKQTKVGDTLESVLKSGEKIGGDLMSALSRTNNLKAAAIGGAIGAVGGIAYSAVHDTHDPTSTYEEPKNYVSNALKTATVAGTVGYGVQTGINMRNPAQSGEMVAYIGNSARGLGGKVMDVMVNAWKACPNIR